MPGGDTKISGGIADVIDGSRRTLCCAGVWTWALSSTSRENFEEEEERETILDKVVLRKVYNKGLF